MQRNEVEAIFQERKEKLLQGITPAQSETLGDCVKILIFAS